MTDAHSLAQDIRACRLCAEDFAATKTAHSPRPVAWFGPPAKVQIIGQAPGIRVHESGRPFTDPSGDRLRAWLAVDEATFWDKTLFSITPMAFCFPGYDAKNADLPPPKRCAATWHDKVARHINAPLTLLIGGYAQRHYLAKTTSVTQTVANWQAHAPAIFPLPHPSWRNTAWIKKNPWFETELLPALRARISALLESET
ncbi:MAG: uracil-DNA glycosylase family protein [Maritimibacter sp.]